MLAMIIHIRGTDAGSITTDWVVLAASAILLAFTVTGTASDNKQFGMSGVQIATSSTASVSVTN